MINACPAFKIFQVFLHINGSSQNADNFTKNSSHLGIIPASLLSIILYQLSRPAWTINSPEPHPGEYGLILHTNGKLVFTTARNWYINISSYFLYYCIFPPWLNYFPKSQVNWTETKTVRWNSRNIFNKHREIAKSCPEKFHRFWRCQVVFTKTYWVCEFCHNLSFWVL